MDVEAEVLELRRKVEQQQIVINMLMTSNIASMKHVDTLEAFLRTLSDLARGTQKQLDHHLDLFRDAGAVPAPTRDEPKKDEPKPKKDVSEHPEFG